MFEVIKNAAIPKNIRGRGMRDAIYPFASLEVGDGFDAPRDMGMVRGHDRRQNSIGCASIAWAKRNNPTAKFTVRILDENTIRCVRIA